MPSPGASSSFGSKEMDGRFAEDGDGGHDNEGAFENGGKILGLVMAEGMFRVRRRFADAEREVSCARDGDVDNAFERVG